MHLPKLAAPFPFLIAGIVYSSDPTTIFLDRFFVKVVSKILILPTSWHCKIAISILAGEERFLPRGFSITEEIAAVSEPDKRRRTHVRHLCAISLRLHASALRPEDNQ